MFGRFAVTLSCTSGLEPCQQNSPHSITGLIFFLPLVTSVYDISYIMSKMSLGLRSVCICDHLCSPCPVTQQVGLYDGCSTKHLFLSLLFQSQLQTLSHENLPLQSNKSQTRTKFRRTIKTYENNI